MLSHNDSTLEREIRGSICWERELVAPFDLLLVKRSCTKNKRQYFETLASKAEEAAKDNDMRTLCKTAKSMKRSYRGKSWYCCKSKGWWKYQRRKGKKWQMERTFWSNPEYANTPREPGDLGEWRRSWYFDRTTLRWRSVSSHQENKIG